MRAALAALALAGCSGTPAAPSAGDAPTIVSLNPCSDAILAEVAEPEQLLAISHYSHDPRSTSMDLATARGIPATGGTVEEVAALAPDIVVGSSFMAPATRAALERLGMRVETVGMAATVADSEAQVRKLAKIAGHPDRGEALVRRIEASLAVPPGPSISAALWQAGGIVPGRGTLIADLMRHAGFASWSEAHGMAQADYLALETILADPPALLLVSGSEAGQAHPVLARLPDMEVARFDPALTYCGGPSIPRAMDRLKRLRAHVQPTGGGRA
ncbi:ABC transporter substrate-binding protein [Qipengyuania sp.]|uniref:ABC transporter substrate-binding protein n=1 Tax=Qipengyuania sp. TaxID=2004515 RepID=UPI0035C7B46E